MFTVRLFVTEFVGFGHIFRQQFIVCIAWGFVDVPGLISEYEDVGGRLDVL